jgi:hypothetical protein
VPLSWEGRHKICQKFVEVFGRQLIGRDGGELAIPMLNEAAGLPRLLRSLAALEPPPAEVLAVDGGSTDASRPNPPRQPCGDHLRSPGRRLGALRANWIYLKVGARWGLGFRKGLERHYPDVR